MALMRLRHGGHASSEKKKITDFNIGQIITVDFVIYPKTKKKQKQKT